MTNLSEMEQRNVLIQNMIKSKWPPLWFFLFPLQINFKKIKRGREPIDENTPRVINHKQCLDNDFLVQKKKKQTVGKNK